MYRNLNAECARAGITRNELAQDILKISPSSLWRKMKLRDGFKISEAVKVKQALNSQIPIEDLFEFDDCDEIHRNED